VCAFAASRSRPCPSLRLFSKRLHSKQKDH
jgi:hypothetical protein